ncbi:unnamed protein product [Bursaphelenchus xylophilus]|uniref:(pine wood nematode) hypothetical protein n=1 Tax=Bursaphelenchus xylophilus TaxID=6326 RepID=A0A1I7S2U0_BURXY|nr:unnamed protein product [Bursaphelenchus xylophilus]CAG9121610.1 unnamed protein product [Bursaphelenchus xylophilus]
MSSKKKKGAMKSTEPTRFESIKEVKRPVKFDMAGHQLNKGKSKTPNGSNLKKKETPKAKVPTLKTDKTGPDESSKKSKKKKRRNKAQEEDVDDVEAIHNKPNHKKKSPTKPEDEEKLTAIVAVNEPAGKPVFMEDTIQTTPIKPIHPTETPLQSAVAKRINY